MNWLVNDPIAGPIMAEFVLKPDSADDWYVIWSTVVDCPVAWGTRADLADLGYGANQELYALVDACGSSERWGPDGAAQYSWEARRDDTALFLAADEADVIRPGGEQSTLRISRIREFCEKWDRGENRTDIVEWESDVAVTDGGLVNRWADSDGEPIPSFEWRCAMTQAWVDTHAYAHAAMESHLACDMRRGRSGR